MKCAFCNRTIVRQTPYSGEFVEYDGKFWHPACLIHKRTAKGTRKDKWPDDSQTIAEKLDALRKQTQEKIQAVQDKEKLYQYLTTQYGAYFLPKQFFMRLDQVFNGTFPGLYNSIADMLARRAAIRNALSQSNAQTKVTIAGREYTMAEAIEMRKAGVKLKQQFVDVMMSEYEKFEKRAREWNNEALTNSADAYISKMYGSRDAIDAQTVEASRAAYIEANKMEIVDPLDVRKKAEALQNEIDQFMSEVDSRISVSNAITQLTISY